MYKHALPKFVYVNMFTLMMDQNFQDEQTYPVNPLCERIPVSRNRLGELGIETNCITNFFALAFSPEEHA